MLVILERLDRYGARVYGQVNVELCDKREAGFAIDCTYIMNDDGEGNWPTSCAPGRHVTGPVSGLLSRMAQWVVVSVHEPHGPKHPITQCKYRLSILLSIVALL
jgi:hypothetical protein